MTTFQPGDVVRLTGEGWGSISHYPGDPIIGGEITIGPRDTFLDCTGRSWWVDDDLFAAELATRPLSPQAALDAILDNWCAQYEPGAWCDYSIGTTTLTARKVDGHWQVKSVGGGE